MPFPSIEEYTDTLRLPLGKVLSDPLLAYGEIVQGSTGQPVVSSGNFALTYQVTSGGRRYALRCFHRESDALLLRYKAIVKKLRSIRSPHFVYFDFQSLGIRTESGSYPIVRMDWADGDTLARFVATHRNDPEVLQQLRTSLRALAAHLLEHGIAHGDVQPGNVIVRNAHALRLIDYDGMFVPELAPLISAELGQRNFQHPGRTALHFDQRMDIFSFCVLDLALEALARQPDLWNLTDSDEQAFVLRAADFADPGNSYALSLIAQVPEMAVRAQHFAAVCVSAYERIPSFEDFLAGRNIPPTRVFPAPRPEALQRPAYTSAYSVIHAADFAQCCAHIGHRVELIGRIARVVRMQAANGQPPGLRLELGKFPRDLACVTIAEAVWSETREAIAEDWVDQWISVTGLVNPVTTEATGDARLKYVSIELEDAFLLRRLSEGEARYRIGEAPARVGSRTEVSGILGTDPVEPESAGEKAALAAVPARPPPAVPEEVAVEEVPLKVMPPLAAHRPAADEPSFDQAPPGLQSVRKSGLTDEGRAPARPVARPGSARSRDRRRRWAMVSAAAAAIFAAVLYFGKPETGRVPEADSAVSSRGDSIEVAPAAGEGRAPPAPAGLEPVVSAPVPVELRSAARVRSADGAVPTVAGLVRVVADENRPDMQLATLNEQPFDGLQDGLVEFVYHAVFSDRDVVVGYTDCLDGGEPCGRRRPFWLVLFPERSPRLLRSDEIWSSGSSAGVTALASGVHVPLGVWDGVRRIATLTARDEVYVTRSVEPMRPLQRGDCRTVARALESCARSSECRDFESSSRRIPADRQRALNRLFHETTGFNAPAFAEFCQTSCELALTPSYGFIRTRVCSGSEDGQWADADGPVPGSGPAEAQPTP